MLRKISNQKVILISSSSIKGTKKKKKKKKKIGKSWVCTFSSWPKTKSANPTFAELFIFFFFAPVYLILSVFPSPFTH